MQYTFLEYLKKKIQASKNILSDSSSTNHLLTEFVKSTLDLDKSILLMMGFNAELEESARLRYDLVKEEVCTESELVGIGLPNLRAKYEEKFGKLPWTHFMTDLSILD